MTAIGGTTFDSNNSLSPLAVACNGSTEGHTQIVQELLETSLIRKKSEPIPLLIYGCLAGNLETVKLLLPHNKLYNVNYDITFNQYHQGQEMKGFVSTLEKTVQDLITQEITTLLKFQPINVACSRNYLKILQFLLSLPQITDNWQLGFTTACSKQQFEIILFFLRHPNIIIHQNLLQQAFSSACKTQSDFGTEIISDLLHLIDPTEMMKRKFGGNRRLGMISGGYPLIVTCWQGNPNSIRLLLNDPRVDPNFEEKGNLSAFNVVCLKGYTEIVEIMLNDTRIEISKFSGGITRFHSKTTAYYSGNNPTIRCAIYSRNIDLIQLLFKHERTSSSFDLKTCQEILQHNIQDYRKAERDRKRRCRETAQDPDYGTVALAELPQEIPKDYIDTGCLFCSRNNFTPLQLVGGFTREGSEIQARINMSSYKSARKISYLQRCS